MGGHWQLLASGSRALLLLCLLYETRKVLEETLGLFPNFKSVFFNKTHPSTYDKGAPRRTKHPSPNHDIVWVANFFIVGHMLRVEKPICAFTSAVPAVFFLALLPDFIPLLLFLFFYK